MKKTARFVGLSIALTLIFYMLAFFLFPSHNPSTQIVTLFAGLAIGLVWLGEIVLSKNLHKRSGRPKHPKGVQGIVILLCVATVLSGCTGALRQQSQIQAANSPRGGPRYTGPGNPVALSSNTALTLIRRVTGIAFLRENENEQPGFGLYSYVLLSHKPDESEVKKYQALVKALLQLPRSASVINYTSPDHVNIVYFLVISLPEKFASMKIEDQINYIIDNYDYGRAASLLGLLEINDSGPVIAASLNPIKNQVALAYPPITINLSSTQPAVMFSYVEAFKRQAAMEDFRQSDPMANFALNVQNVLETAAEGFGQSKDAVKSLVKYIKDVSK